MFTISDTCHMHVFIYLFLSQMVVNQSLKGWERGWDIKVVVVTEEVDVVQIEGEFGDVADDIMMTIIIKTNPQQAKLLRGIKSL